MNEKRPIIITIIADLIILAAMFSIGATIFPGYFEKLGFHMNSMPIFSNSVMNILLSLVLTTAAVGLLLLKKWGYRLMIIYNIFFMLINVIWCLQNGKVPLNSGIIFSFIILADIIPYRKCFMQGVGSAGVERGQ
ncbi:hypothetical protein [Ruminiclostridium papyrosolvens]|uniref:Uncharacterized protein n=1 Tax=Ruminiclostridium papyrosolvens C7 TaxID=1330534 RepID=U4R614_9FIRM|nr:hypothetical protein [Ruminiclostridium papyrosolvens]EPR14274.1 hypothetical protein L323_00270 [Ruminiclostridium papyrosolvens C7]